MHAIAVYVVMVCRATHPESPSAPTPRSRPDEQAAGDAQHHTQQPTM